MKPILDLSIDQLAPAPISGPVHASLNDDNSDSSRDHMLADWQQARGHYLDKCTQGERIVRSLYNALSEKPAPPNETGGTMLKKLLENKNYPEGWKPNKESKFRTTLKCFQQHWKIRGELVHSTAVCISLSKNECAWLLSNAKLEDCGPLQKTFLLRADDLKDEHRKAAQIVNRLNQYLKEIKSQ